MNTAHSLGASLVQAQYEYLAQQINREDSLVNNRMLWTLQLNGFLFAALALLVDNNSVGDLKKFFAFMIPLVGFFTTAGGTLGVYAAQRQLDYLNEPPRVLWRPVGLSQTDVVCSAS